MNKVLAVIFDMDGVLVEAKEWHYVALNQALELFGLTITRYDHLVTFDGLPTSQKLRMLSEERGLPVGLHPIIEALKQKYTMRLIRSNCEPRFEHEYAIRRLRGEGMRLAVASNSIRATLDAMLGEAGLLPFFEFTLSNQDVSEPKPSPEIYNLAIRRMGLTSHQVLIVEDNERGLAAARASGAHVMRVSEVDEVNYWRIKDEIRRIEGLSSCK